MFVQAILLALGVFLFPTRFIGLMCQTFCSCYFIITLIICAVFRFNSMGQLASLSMAGSSFTTVDGVATVSTDTTYEMDGKRILNLWIVSLIFAVAQCLLGCYAAAPPT